jgi:hypothetical protein
MRLAGVLILAAAALAGATWSSLVAMNLSAPTMELRAPSPPPPGLPRRVLVVVIDGLGGGPAADVPELAALGRRGAWVEMLAEPPTFSSAQYVAFLTGVGPVDSGVRTNMHPRRTPLDSVVAAVRRQGGRAVEVGDQVDWWSRFFDWDQALVVAPERLVPEARRLIADEQNRLVLVHAVGVDQAGHSTGAASPGYRAAAAVAGRQVAELAAAWGERGTLVVVSDHGHMPRGGHGGSQAAARQSFLVLAGPGVRPGTRDSGASTMHVAPTLAVLLGVPVPAQSLKNPLLDVLDLDDSARSALILAETARQGRVLPLVARGREALLRIERRDQLKRALLLPGLAAATWWLRRRGPAARRGLLHGAAALVLLSGLIWIIAGEVSFGGFRSLKQQAIETGLLALAAGLVSLALPLRAAFLGRLPPPVADSLAGGAAIGASPLALAAFALAGAGGPRFTCRPDWIAAGPTIAYVTLAPILLCAGAVALVARWKGATESVSIVRRG